MGTLGARLGELLSVNQGPNLLMPSPSEVPAPPPNSADPCLLPACGVCVGELLPDSWRTPKYFVSQIDATPPVPQLTAAGDGDGGVMGTGGGCHSPQPGTQQIGGGGPLITN